ncbi:MAG: sulfatase-like hydrolase/transferase [Luteitalea sp.]|nr:sulfatase-like hydrolase/transferase [Luteitalea sp.]
MHTPRRIDPSQPSSGTITQGSLVSYQVWASLYVVMVWFFLGMEWLFFVTKPSFLSVVDWTGRIGALATATLPLLIAGLALLGALWLVGRAIAPTIGRNAGRWLLQLPLALVLLASLMLLLDNFTHTVFGWGIRSLDRSRLWYAGALLLTGGLLYVWTGRVAAALHASAQHRRRWMRVAAALICAAAAAGVVEAVSTWRSRSISGAIGAVKARPNILLVGLDGANANQMSLYGYQRQTTPFLEELAPRSLVFSNAFSNAGNTAGSLTSILTGRAPTTTRVIYAPDILRGPDTSLHLPAILRALRYRTGQFAVRHYAASVDFNMQNAFDVVNSQFGSNRFPGSQVIAQTGPGRYLFGQVLDRVRTRVEQLANEGKADPFEEITEPLWVQYMDESRMRQVTRFIQESNEPFFAHVHIMVSHGPQFAPRQRRFSVGMKQTDDRMRDFYDDAILDADEYLREIVDLVKQRDAFDNMLLVVYSDHGAGFQTNIPLPLVIRLPGGVRSGRVGVTAQMIDIAPTVLDVLGIGAPRWMEGTSLVRDVPPCRPVFGAISTTPTVQHGAGIATDPVPPFYSLGVVTLVRGNRWRYLKVDRNPPKALGGRVPLLPGAEGCKALEPEEATQMLIEHLRSKRYDVPASFGS